MAGRNCRRLAASPKYTSGLLGKSRRTTSGIASPGVGWLSIVGSHSRTEWTRPVCCKAARMAVEPGLSELITTAVNIGALHKFRFVRRHRRVSTSLLSSLRRRLLARFRRNRIEESARELQTRQWRTGRNRRHYSRCNQHQELCFCPVLRLALEEVPQQRNAAQYGHLVVDVGDAIIYEPRDREALPVAQLHVGIHAARGNRGNEETGNRDGVGVVECADFRPDFEMNGAVVGEIRRKFEADAELLELNRYGWRRARCSSLHNGERKFTAREKIGFFP